MRFDLTVNEFAAELYVRRALEVYGDQFWRPYVHVADAARAVRMVLGAPAEQVAGEVFNVGDTHENYTKADIVRILRDRLGQVDVRRVEVAEDPRDYRVSFAKIERELGFTASRTVPEGIDEVIAALSAGVIADFTEARYRN
jgi:nucleoside-diphosphate-sugar epimerase